MSALFTSVEVRVLPERSCSARAEQRGKTAEKQTAELEEVAKLLRIARLGKAPLTPSQRREDAL
jgi:hypothetical protein